MDLHKFEQNIKEKLERRTIKPSVNAWNKLDTELEFVQDKKSNTLFWVLGIAVSIIGVLWLVTPFFNNDFENSTPIIVDTKTIKNEESTNPIIEGEIVIVENELDTIEISTSSSVIKSVTKKHRISKITKEQFTLSESKGQKIEVVVNQKNRNQNQLIIEEQKVTDLAVGIKNLNPQKYTISDAEIDALLNKVQKELALNKIYSENNNTVDANLLLQDVEADLDKSFRSKVFEALKINYENMVTTVSERNN